MKQLLLNFDMVEIEILEIGRTVKEIEKLALGSVYLGFLQATQRLIWARGSAGGDRGRKRGNTTIRGFIGLLHRSLLSAFFIFRRMLWSRILGVHFLSVRVYCIVHFFEC